MIGRFVILFCLAATSALAKDWRPYATARFGYAVDLSAGFTIANQADNGDGMTLQSADGMPKLRVFAANRTDGSFAAEITSRIEMDTQDSWQINYSKPPRTFASYCGTRKDRILYARRGSLPRCDRIAHAGVSEGGAECI